jgi:hypothetical protein
LQFCIVGGDDIVNFCLSFPYPLGTLPGLCRRQWRNPGRRWFAFDYFVISHVVSQSQPTMAIEYVS